MPPLVDPELRFTCQSCARCCRGGYDIALTTGEVEAYRKAGVDRLFTEREGDPSGASQDPFEPIPGHPLSRIRRRTDGACGFLSPANRCRIHEELGADRKPLVCQVFPFSFSQLGDARLIVPSFSCPTIVANKGTLVSEQLVPLEKLERRFSKAFGEAVHRPAFASGKPIEGSTLGDLRAILQNMLQSSDLRTSVRRMAWLLEDLWRPRVLRLPPEGFSEYLRVMGRHFESVVPAVDPPTFVSRLTFRGFVFTVMATALRLGEPPGTSKLSQYLRTLLLLLHVHGVGPGSKSHNLRALGRSRIPARDPKILAIIQNYLRSTIATLGSRGSVLEDMAVSVGVLNSGLILAAVRAGERGEREADASDVTFGLTTAADLVHVRAESLMGRLLTGFTNGWDGLLLLASGRFFGKEVVVYDEVAKP